ncbi:lytic transglycosylase domain-containing protein [Sphingomonas cannabina]|uniref:lytic transglycosylase domain-containing protein n=1 Tax=Sphingomonas cannabina TaxID=2899123 RepID=UPI001F2DC28A|nr:lytic transglycosylase domain-containing protein [Sphingomonas cannabina]UIJ44899.1 lytic transglycosylase domain-containing protein [Sphingomonas cannabina]
MPAARHQPAVGGRITHRRAALLLLSGLILAAPGTSPAGAQQAPAERPSRGDPYGDYIAEAAQRFGVPEAWIRAVMRVESAGDVRAISSAGAMGLMQIMPATWAELRVRHRLGSNPYDPRDNILAGAAYLREMHDRYGSPGFLAAYNAGPGRYEEYLAGRPLPAETRAYVATLAPIVGDGELTGPVMVATADPLAWTRAPLFVVQAAGSGPVAPVLPERAPGETAAAIPARDQGPAASRTERLFVARSVSGGPR